MSTKEKFAVKILLLLARMLVGEPWAEEIKQLSYSINVWANDQVSA